MQGGERAGMPNSLMSMLNHVENRLSCVLAVDLDIVSAKNGGSRQVKMKGR